MGEHCKPISKTHLKAFCKNLCQANYVILTQLTIIDGTIKVGLDIWLLKILLCLPILEIHGAFTALLSSF